MTDDKSHAMPHDRIFHGSADKHLKIIRPALVDGMKTPHVFASRYKAMASCFLLDWDPDRMRYFYTQNGTVYFISHDPDEIAQRDRGGSLYELAAHDFAPNERTGMEYMEWLANTPQRVLRETPYSSAIAAMRMNGVHVLRVSPHIFQALQSEAGDDTFVLLTDPQMEEMTEFLETHGKIWERKRAA